MQSGGILPSPPSSLYFYSSGEIRQEKTIIPSKVPITKVCPTYIQGREGVEGKREMAIGREREMEREMKFEKGKGNGKGKDN